MYKLIGQDEILKKGVTDFSQLRPVATNYGGMAANATLRKDEWEQIDARVNDVMRERLTIVDDLRARGLVTQVSLGTILRVTERLSAMDPAEISFDGDTAPQKDKPNYEKDVIPVPIISKDFTVSWRQLEASRSRGEPMDVTGAALAARAVRDKMQDLFVNGFDNAPGGGATSIPGLLTAANRITVSNGIDWDLSGSDPVGDVLRMLNAAYAKNLFGPFNLYIPKNYWGAVQEDYSALKGDRTFMQRLLAYEDITAVRPLDALPDDNVVLVQMTEDVIELTEAQPVTTVQWEKNPFVMNLRVLQVGGPHIKSMETTAGAGSTIHGIIHMS